MLIGCNQRCDTVAAFAHRSNLHLGGAFFWYLADEIEKTIFSPQGNIMPGRDTFATCAALQRVRTDCTAVLSDIVQNVTF